MYTNNFCLKLVASEKTLCYATNKAYYALYGTCYMSRAIWYHLFNLKHVKITHGGVLLLVKLQAEAFNFTESNTPPWVFFTFCKLYK